MPSKLTAKKGSRKPKAKKPLPSRGEPYSKLKQEVEILRRELGEAMGQRENRNLELSALYDVTVSANQSLEIKPVLQEVVKKITEIFNFDVVSILLLDTKLEQLTWQAGFTRHDLGAGPRVHPRGEGIGWRVAETGEPIIFEDVNTDPRYQELSHSQSAQRGGAGFFAVFPIKAKGRFLGTIQCRGREPRKLTPDEFRLITSMSDQIGVALENINLFEEVRNKTMELEARTRQLEGASRHKSQFLANVNHELRTPVSAIIGYARLVLRETEGQISQLQRENLQDLLSNAERLLAQIDSLLDFSKIEAGKMEVHLEPVRVDEVIDGAVSTIEPTLNNDSVRLIREIAPDIPVLNTDREKLRQIIVNLLGNAAKFTELGEIKISAFRQNRSLKLVISDTGIGIEKEDLNQVFEEFYRGGLSSTKKYRGTGLGLAIVKKFVNLLGGEIGVESEVGKGSTFTVVLPFDYRERE
jgi:signal transduction histidine kinase